MSQSAWSVRYDAYSAKCDALLAQHRHLQHLLQARTKRNFADFVRASNRLRVRFNQCHDRIPTP